MPYAQGQEDLGRSGGLLDADDAAGRDNAELWQDKSVKTYGLTKHCEPGFYTRSQPSTYTLG